MTVLIIAEKPNVARKIAYALADGKPLRRSIGKAPYYILNREGKRIIVAPAVGHLFSLAPREKSYGYPVFDIHWVPVYALSGGKTYVRDYIKALATLAKQADEFIVACDYDTEGEVIGYTALKYACGVDPRRAKRMKFSALTKKDLLRAWYNVEPTINFGMADAGITRHVLDWYWGVNLSRALTRAVKRASGRWMVLSTGRVQGPTLKFLVEREREILNFKPEPYWVVRMVVEKEGKRYTTTHEKEKIKDEDEAKRVVAEARRGPAIVERIEVKKQKRNPPVPFDLGTLQREAYSAFGYTPKKVLDVAQRLYERALISYPRTSSQKLPKNVNLRSIIKNLAKLPEYKPFAHLLLGRDVLRPVEGRKVDPAHPAIYPTGEVPKRGELSKDEMNIYDLVVRRFLALFMEPVVRESVKVVITSNGHRFLLGGSRTLKEGWLKVYGKYVKFNEVKLPRFTKGENLDIIQVRREKKHTKPPARYSPAAVIKKMEDLGIGTKATRAQILETLYQRGYIEGKRKIKVTPLGMRVIEALDGNVPDIVSVELTRRFEEEMEAIEKRKKEGKEVVLESRNRLINILEQFKSKEDVIGRMLAGSSTESTESKGEKDSGGPLIVGECPKCGGKLILRHNRKTGKRFVGCSNWPKCDVTYPVPQRGKVVPTGRRCCNGAPIVKIKYRGREYEVCLDMNCERGSTRGDKKRVSK